MLSKKTVALYIRLSVEDSKTDSLSITNQQISLHKYVADLPEYMDAELLEFIDNGHSGTNFERPAIQELLGLVRENKVDCIVVKDFSRFGRNMLETGYFIEKVFPLFRTRFIAVSDLYDSEDYKEDTGGIDVTFKYLISEYYSRDLSVKSKAAKYSKMKRGEYQSKLCSYGYIKGENGRLEIDEDAAKIVRLIFDLSLNGSTAHQITEELYQRNVPTPGEYKAAKGYKHYDSSDCQSIWQRSSVLRILGDERYIGTYIMGKRAVREVGGNRMRLKAESEWFKLPDHHPAIIDKALFEQVQSQLLHFKSVKQCTHNYPLRGKVICGSCGHCMQRVAKKEPVFVCKYTKAAPSFSCYGLSIVEKELEDMIWGILVKQAQVIQSFDNSVDVGQLTFQLATQSGYEEQIADLQSNKMRLYEQYLSKEIDLERYKSLKSGVDAKLSETTQMSSSLKLQTRLLQFDNSEKKERLEIANKITSQSRLTENLAELLIDKVMVYPQMQIEIVWKAKDFCGK